MALYTVVTNGPQHCAANGCQIGEHTFKPSVTREMELTDDEVEVLRASFVGADKQIASIEKASGKAAQAPAPAPAATPAEPAPAPRRSTRSTVEG